jgi:hypothetical protein
LLQKEGNLQGVVEELVHLGNLGRDAEVDCPVANLDDEATNDIRVDLARVNTCAKGVGEEYTYGVLDLELLASTDVARLGDGGLEAVEGLVVQGLSWFPSSSASHSCYQTTSPLSICLREPYLRAGNHHLDLTAGGAHELGELGADAGQEAQAVVRGEGGEQVLDGLASGADALLQLGDDGGLVGDGQGRGLEDGDQLGVPLHQVAEGDEALGGGLEGRGLDGGRVLFIEPKQNDAG